MIQEQNKEAINQKYNVLYVDDEEINLRIFKSGFRRSYNVFTALSGQEAIELMRKENIHLIVTDQKMPEMSGTELLEQTVDEFPNLMRIILTGFADIEAIIKAINKCGVYKYVTKPYDKGEMKLTMDKALESLELKKQKNGLVDELHEVNQALEKLNSELEDKVKLRTEELEKSNERFKASIEYASFIQKSMLPLEEELENSLLKPLIYHKPLEKVSGDYYWHGVIPDNENIEVIALLDCTGHGVPGALLSMIGDLLMNDIIYNKQISDPQKILMELNIGVQAILNQDKNSNRDGMDVAIVVMDKMEEKILFSGAKQEIMIFRNGEPSVIRGAKFGIGGNVELDVNFETHKICLDEIESFYLYSDGYKDQFGGGNSKKFSKNSFTNLLTSINEKRMDHQKNALRRELENWMGDKDQTDDVLVMGFKVKKNK